VTFCWFRKAFEELMGMVGEGNWELFSGGLVRSDALTFCINLGNPLLARRDGVSPPEGVSVDLAIEFAARLDLPHQLLVVDAAGVSVEAVEGKRADLGFFAVDPQRAAQIAFTAPYLLIEGCYLVRQDSPIESAQDVDQAGVRVAVGRGSAYDLFLARNLKQASIVRAATSPTVVDTFLSQGLDVAAGVRQQLEFDAARITGLRLVPGRFMQIAQAMGVHRRHGPALVNMVDSFVDEMKRSGFIARSLDRHGIAGASVAPAVHR
jgi:polar amino acid transport system substrate-binding protein